MPIARCIDCGKGRRHVAHGGIPKRCKSCARIAQQAKNAAYRLDRRRKGICYNCARKRSKFSAVYCATCVRKNAERSAVLMREKRAKFPAYREDERNKVRARMRAIRDERRKAGITGNGTPYKSQAMADRYGLSAN